MLLGASGAASSSIAHVVFGTLAVRLAVSSSIAHVVFGILAICLDAL
jgi:hypothetical protein